MKEAQEREERHPLRAPAIVAVIVAAVVVAFLVLTSGGDEYEVTAQFENASALVSGNQVVVGGRPVGTVEEVRSRPTARQTSPSRVDEDFAPLRRGTVATVRWAALSSVANRQVQLTLPPEGVGGEEIPDGGVLSQAETIADGRRRPVLQHARPTRRSKDFKRVIKGFARSYEGVAEQANRGYKYLNPLLYNGRRVFAELELRPGGARSAAGRRVALRRRARRPRSSDLSAAGPQPEPDDERDRRSQARARARDRPAAAVHAQRQHDVRQPARGARRPRSRWSSPRSRPPGAAPVPGRAARDGAQRGADRSRPLGDHPPPRRAQRPGRAPAHPAAPAQDRGRLGLSRLRARARGPRGPRRSPADDDYTQGSFGEAICSLHNGARQPRASSAPTRRSWSAGSTASATPATSTRSAASAGSARPSTPSRRRCRCSPT